MQHHPAANVVHTAQLGKLGKPDYLSALSRELASKTFVEGNALSSADLQLLPGALGAAAAAAPLDDNARLKVAHALRWLDHVQHHPAVAVAAAGVAAVAVSLAVPDRAAAARAAGQGGGCKQQGKKKKEKKATAPVVVSPYAGIAELDIRVGLIVSAEAHPDAEKLYVEQIDVGEDAPRTVCSGLRPFMEVETLVNKRCLVLCNTKPTPMRGVTSTAMVLAAGNDEHTIVELLTPPEGAPPGTRIGFKGVTMAPASGSKMAKKKLFVKAQPDLKTDASGVAHFKDLAFTCEGHAGGCTSSLKSAGIS